MRLTQLKLAGFKSFVDPTTLHIHGQRVGVVGPNGCGKSNVMESVRWVLGESSAKEMRGESMDAVIFNGSANRKAIMRASVELLFDNRLGSVAGAWSQYAEISVKRVIERDKGSTYYINNQVVRRRDVSDLFLGTGLGRNSYAIIGQNTISRIVEAKPEELRVFLEEAAGISQYKERRRETELRLRDTRDNLARVEDIRQEIDKQIQRLQSQAAVTQQYHGLQASLKTAQASLLFIYQRDTGLQFEKSQRHVDKLVNELESQTAVLRKTETELERLRQQHFEQTQLVQQAQADFYDSNAHLANLETQIKHHQEAKQRLQTQQEQTLQQAQQLAEQIAQWQQELHAQQAQTQTLQAEFAQVQSSLHQLQAQQPDLTQTLQLQREAKQQASAALNELQSNIKIHQVKLANTQAQSEQLRAKQQQLHQQMEQLEQPDQDAEQTLQQALQQAQHDRAQLQQQWQFAQEQAQSLSLDISQAQRQLTQAEQALMQQQAQIDSLQHLLQTWDFETEMQSWLTTAGLQHAPRVWQSLRITPGWELAVQAVLAQQLNAIAGSEIAANALTQRPPSRLSYWHHDVPAPNTQPLANATPLLSLIACDQPALRPALAHLLADVYATEQDWPFDTRATDLTRQQCLVNRHGDVLTAYGVTLNAAAGDHQGMLQRQAECQQRLQALPELTKQHQQAQAQLQQLQAQQAEQTTQQALLQQQQQSAMQRCHECEMQLQRLQQAQQHAQARAQALQAEWQQTAQQLTQLEQQLHDQQAWQQQLLQEAPQRQAQLEQAESSLQQVEQASLTLQQSFNDIDKRLQEKQFALTINHNKIHDIETRLQQGQEAEQRLQRQQNEIQLTLDAAKMESLQQLCQLAVADKQAKELALTQARENMTQWEQGLQQQERFRIQIEQLIHPMRDKLEQARLQAQEVRLKFEAYQTQLLQSGADIHALAEQIPAHAKAETWQNTTLSLTQQIEQLGPVNLAAIQELQSEQERKGYLDSQAQDLETAISTLQAAIVKIDQETRTRLQRTYDDANQYFSELFKDLFGGGQAKLELLGDEILDTGVQVFAQPPGKKNSTIQLLSGGEKALTALALVFALFKLNPAPFCLMDEVDAPLDDSNTLRFCEMVKKMSARTQFIFVSHNKISMEMAQQLIGVTMQESGVSRVVEVDMQAAVSMQENAEA